MLGQRHNEADFRRPVTEFLRTDFATVQLDWTVEQTLAEIRRQPSEGGAIYFYVIDAEGVLRGVVPTRRLLGASLEQGIVDIMIRRVVAVPETATLLDACEFFVLYKYFALPVVDAQRRIKGVIDVALFTEEVLNIDDSDRGEELFQAIGFHVEELRNATPAKAFRFRFPWLLATITGGTLCAVLTGVFAATLEERIALAFFLTLVLGLGESVGAQSMAVTLQALHAARPNLRWLFTALRREFLTAVMLGCGCAALVFAIVAGWQRDVPTAACIGFSIVMAMITACLLGLIVPTSLRMLKLDPKIASGPLTLAIVDLCTLAWYFGTATLVLR